MRALRIASALILVAAAGMAMAIANLDWLLVAIALAVVARALVWRSLNRAIRSTLPIAVFAGLLTAMQWASSAPVTSLPLKTIAVFLLTTTAFRLLPWSDVVSAVRPGARLFGLVLFALFVEHFFVIFAAETQRVLQARALRLSRLWGRGSFRSLTAAVVALFRRSLVRAERFYAAQLLRGLAE